MTAVEIIDEIRHLPPDEKARVVSFVRTLDKKLTPEQLNDLAQKLVDAKTEEEARALKERITTGFYGE
jgi:hypothetical protein